MFEPIIEGFVSLQWRDTPDGSMSVAFRPLSGGEIDIAKDASLRRTMKMSADYASAVGPELMAAIEQRRTQERLAAAVNASAAPAKVGASADLLDDYDRYELIRHGVAAWKFADGRDIPCTTENRTAFGPEAIEWMARQVLDVCGMRTPGEDQSSVTPSR